MIAENALVLLDTSIVVHLCRNGRVGKWIGATYNLENRVNAPLISVISVGEALAFGRGWGWGSQKQQALRILLANLVTVDINSPNVLKSYAEISTHLKTIARPMGQNDMWIAATAMATGAVVLTTDRDFDVLHPSHVQREWIDQRAIS